MDSNYKPYEYIPSFGRLDSILNQSDVAYEEVDSLPDRDRLTFSNGFYAYCSALFIDIRDSSRLPGKYRRPTLARIYRAYISELVAVMNGDRACREINIVGDGVWCVVNTPLKSDIDNVFKTAYTANSMIKTLNYKLDKKGIDNLHVGIGMEYGRALMIKAGYSGSGINDVVYMGDVVNRAAKLASEGGKEAGYFSRTPPFMVGSVFYGNLNDDNKALLGWDALRDAWVGDVVRMDMDAWYSQNCT